MKTRTLRAVSTTRLLMVWTTVGCRPPQYPPTAHTDLNVCVRDPQCTVKLAVGHRATGAYNL